MENLARAFGLPVDSPEHRDLAENGWIGGSGVTVRYWLGRVLRRNLFRESEEALSTALQQFFVDRGFVASAIIFRDSQAWPAAATLLQQYAAESGGCNSPKNPLLVAALEAVIRDPESSDAQLAAVAGTTPKQLARMTQVSSLRRIWRLRNAARH